MVDVQQLKATLAVSQEETPSGAWAGAPATAATGVDMVNDSGYAVWVSVTGGTVTAVKINGVSTGLTAGTFRVANGGAIQWTGSGAPTVKWYYE